MCLHVPGCSFLSNRASASDGLYTLIASTSANLAGWGLVCWSHSLSISRRQLSGSPLYRVLIAVRRPWLSDSMVPIFIHWRLNGSKILSIVDRVGRLSDVLFAAEAALDEPCALPPPPSINYNDNLINHKHYYKAGYINCRSTLFAYT